ncbi:MAG: hypothetical protein AABY86_06000, partial [Bdellovibrionota bacterium]
HLSFPLSEKILSLFAQEILKEASPTQQQQALAQLRPLPPNMSESLAFQKWRLIQQLKNQGIHHLNTPELRLLATYPESLYACAYQGQPTNQAVFQQWKAQISALAQLPYAKEALNCPANMGEREEL